jgi:hypothetical protein
MAKRIKLMMVSVVLAVLLALASSVAISGWVATVDSSPGVIEMQAGPIGGGGSAS